MVDVSIPFRKNASCMVESLYLNHVQMIEDLNRYKDKIKSDDYDLLIAEVLRCESNPTRIAWFMHTIGMRFACTNIQRKLYYFSVDGLLLN